MSADESRGAGRFWFKPPESLVYPTLAEHQVSHAAYEAPEMRTVVTELRRWEHIFVDTFRLNIPRVTLTVEKIDARAFGHFRNGCNGYGLFYELAINSSYVHKRQGWETLGTLLHELLHCWQYVHGSPGRNKKRFQNEGVNPRLSIRFAQMRLAARSWKAWKCSPNLS